tara:strand:+ start:825 stop:944 length:120 start_codon:yes stop_codon:yes gene_type:complete
MPVQPNNPYAEQMSNKYKKFLMGPQGFEPWITNAPGWYP